MAPISFQPGPVSIAPAVRTAMQQEPISHRSMPFRLLIDRVTARLTHLTNAPQVAIQAGSGTLANDMVAGQLASQPGRGLILDNGEFGARLVDHARRFDLDHEVYEVPWGSPFDLVEIASIVDRKRLSWVWATHCETSTGVLNDLEGLKRMAQDRAILLCMDCIGSLGTVPLNLDGVHLASGTSGKGLGSYSGLALVFSSHLIAPNSRLPRSLDVGYHLSHGGIPFTLSSNLLAALDCALGACDSASRLPELRAQGAYLRARLVALGYRILAPQHVASPAVVTIVLPPDRVSESVGDRLADAGFLVSYQSRYLLERNWFQICLMGDTRIDQVDALLDALSQLDA
jgi:aspartate aminotransferase-like enzyme